MAGQELVDEAAQATSGDRILEAEAPGAAGSRQLPSLTADERAAILTPERACREPEGRAAVGGPICEFLERPRQPPPVPLEALFLGPKGENADLVERLLAKILRRTVDGRRGFHADDAAVAPAPGARPAAFGVFWENLEQELDALMAELEAGVPAFSPRHVAHFLGDTALPAVLAAAGAMLHNPNNVSWEAGPVTTLLELQAGRDLAEMIGWGRTPEELARTWGHLASGGTLANVESLWVAKAASALPLAIRAAAAELGLALATPAGRALGEADDWELASLGPTGALDLRDGFLAAAGRGGVERGEALERLAAHDVFTRGDQVFFEALRERARRGAELGPAVLVGPQTLHYGWAKAARLLGLGADQIWAVPVDGDCRMDLDALRATLLRARAERRPVLEVVAVAGSTEEGAVDRLDRIVALRDELRASGLGFLLHCDAAYGGYFAACFRDASGARRELGAIQAQLGGWPPPEVHAAFGALAGFDGVTIDPHKLGYVPYPAGAIAFRDGRVRELLAQEATYALGGGEGERPRGIYLGRYTLEGSKPGSAAAAVCLSHRVIPLDERGYGALLGRTAAAARALHDRLPELGARSGGELLAAAVARPDTNVVCYLFNLAGNARLDVMNRLNLEVYRRLSLDPDEPVRRRPFLVSHTELDAGTYSPAVVGALLERLGVPAAQLLERRGARRRTGPDQAPGADDHVVVLRSALMSPFLLDEARPGRSTLDLILDDLLAVLREAREAVAGRSALAVPD